MAFGLLRGEAFFCLGSGLAARRRVIVMHSVELVITFVGFVWTVGMSLGVFLDSRMNSMTTWRVDLL